MQNHISDEVKWSETTLGNDDLKELNAEDKATLIENFWSGILILDQIHHRMHNHIPDETTLAAMEFLKNEKYKRLLRRSSILEYLRAF